MSSTASVTSTTVEGRVRILVTREGRCKLDDLSAPDLTGAGGPVCQELLQQALEQELSAQGAESQLMTDGLAEQLTHGE